MSIMSWERIQTKLTAQITELEIETVSGHSLTGGTNQSVQFLKNDWNSVENCNGPSSPHLSIFYQLYDNEHHDINNL